jgi:hypothetical protein
VYHVNTLNAEAVRLLFLVLEGPHQIPGEHAQEIREWEQQRYLFGWVRWLWFAVRFQHIHRYENYAQVAATALWVLRSWRRPGPHTSPAEEWLPATEAVKRAGKSGYEITLPWFSRSAAKFGVRTRPRQLQGTHKLEVEWKSFTAYLVDHRKPKDGEEHGQDELEQRVKDAQEQKRLRLD